MKKFIVFLLLLLCIVQGSVMAEQPPEIPNDLRSTNLLLYDTSSNMVIYEKNSSQKIQPGGIAKILTAAIIINETDTIEQSITAKAEAIDSYDFTLNNMGVLTGENMSIKNLLYGMLLYDAGEAANVVAVNHSNSIKAFADKMNDTAKEIGCTDTYFTNPSGMYDEKQYTTLEDAVKIVKYAMKSKVFCDIVATQSHTIAPTNKYKQQRHLNNSNKFIMDLYDNQYYNKYVTGVKTSYISNSNCGLVIKYEKENTKLLCMAMGAPYEDGINYATSDCQKLLKYGLVYSTPVKIASGDEIFAEIQIKGGKESDKVLLVAQNDFYVNLPKGYDETKIEKIIEKNKKIKAPVSKGDALGQLTVNYNGEKYGSMVLTADQNVNYSATKYFIQSIIAFFTSWIFILVVTLLILAFLWYTVQLNKAKRRRKYRSRFRD